VCRKVVEWKRKRMKTGRWETRVNESDGSRRGEGYWSVSSSWLYTTSRRAAAQLLVFGSWTCIYPARAETGHPRKTKIKEKLWYYYYIEHCVQKRVVLHTNMSDIFLLFLFPPTTTGKWWMDEHHITIVWIQQLSLLRRRSTHDNVGIESFSSRYK
jgi:hypothetical protein